MRRLGPRCVLALLACAAASLRTVLYEKQSPYTFISVTEDGEGRRNFQFDSTGALQSVVRDADLPKPVPSP